MAQNSSYLLQSKLTITSQLQSQSNPLQVFLSSFFLSFYTGGGSNISWACTCSSAEALNMLGPVHFVPLGQVVCTEYTVCMCVVKVM